MKINRIKKIVLVFSFVSSSLYAKEAVVDIKTTILKGFTAKTKDIRGQAKVQDGGKILAENIVVSLKNLDTGMKLRNDHMKDKFLEVNKYPEAILVRGEGLNGTGTGKIKIRGIEKEVKGTYKIVGSEVEAEFELLLSDFGITGINYKGVGVEDKVKLKVSVPIAK